MHVGQLGLIVFGILLFSAILYGGYARLVEGRSGVSRLIEDGLRLSRSMAFFSSVVDTRALLAGMEDETNSFQISKMDTLLIRTPVQSVIQSHTNVWRFNGEQARTNHIIYLHGGAYIFGLKSFYAFFAARLALDAGAIVHLPDYPLAPKHQVKDAYAELLPIYQGVLEETNPEQITIMGDSAGGGLSLGFCQQLLETGCPQPGRIILISPWLDITMENPEAAKYDHLDVLLGIPGLIEIGHHWAGSTDRRDPRLSPIHGTLKGLATIALFVGTREVFYPDCLRLRDLAVGEGVHIDFFEYKNMMHAFPIFPMPEANQARAEMVRIILGSE